MTGLNLNTKLPPAKNPLEIAIKEDLKRFDEIYSPLNNILKEAVDKKAYIESFLICWTFIEQVLLPSLIRQVCHRLKFKKIPKLDERTQLANLINIYYFLSHDLTLYENLLKANSLRKEIIHRLENSHDVSSLGERAKKATKYALMNVTPLLLDRLSGKTTVPVLAIYSKGWNDFRKEFLEIIDSL